MSVLNLENNFLTTFSFNKSLILSRMRLFEVAHRCFYVQLGEKGRGAPYLNRRATRGWGEMPPLPFFWKLQTNFLILEKKVSDCVHPYVKFIIKNVVLRVSKRKNSEIFPKYWYFERNVLTKCLSKSSNFTKPPLPWKSFSYAPAQSTYPYLQW